MTEKVLFEYRTNKDGSGFSIKCAQEFRNILSECWNTNQSSHFPESFCRKNSKWDQQKSKIFGQHMRETLNFFEDVYTDLYNNKNID